MTSMALVGPHLALYNSGSQQSGDNGVKSQIQAGLSEKKIALGFPFYGLSWSLVNANNHDLYAPANGAGLAGDGSIGYNRMKQYITQNNAATVFNSTIVTDYCCSGTIWIGYDNVHSISTKVSYAKGKGLLGHFTWHVGADNNWAFSATGQY